VSSRVSSGAAFLRSIGWERITPALGVVISAWWMDARGQVPRELRKGFDSAVPLISWRLWKERNSRVFNNAPCMVSQAAQGVIEEGDQWIAAGFTALSVFVMATRTP